MSASDFGTIIQIGDILVSEDVIMEYFSCDYGACRGICCVEGDSGAPLEEEELEALERDYPVFCGEMHDSGRRRVDEVGFFEVDRDGDLVTPVVQQTKECAAGTKQGADTRALSRQRILLPWYRMPLAYRCRVSPRTKGSGFSVWRRCCTSGWWDNARRFPLCPGPFAGAGWD